MDQQFKVFDNVAYSGMLLMAIFYICYFFNEIVLKNILLYKKKGRIINSWQSRGIVSHICLYPIKFCKPVVLPKVLATPFKMYSQACKNITDQCHVIVNKNGEVVSRDNFPDISQISVDILKFDPMSLVDDCRGHLKLSYCHRPDFILRWEEKFAHGEEKYVWMDEKWVQGTDCGDKVASWLEITLGLPSARLVYIEPPLDRHENDHNFRTLLNTWLMEQIGLVQATEAKQYSVITKTSVDHLNDISGTQSTYGNYNPHFVITDNMIEDLIPNSEQDWNSFRLGVNSIVHVTAPTLRNPDININPHTGYISNEPFSSLAKYCSKFNMKPQFGINIEVPQPTLVSSHILKVAQGTHQTLQITDRENYSSVEDISMDIAPYDYECCPLVSSKECLYGDDVEFEDFDGGCKYLDNRDHVFTFQLYSVRTNKH